MEKTKIPKLLAFIFASEIFGSIGSVFTTSNIPNWYNNLNKPSIAPPNWVFGPAWITLFFLMGTSAYLVWDRGWKKQKVKKALYLFTIQFVFNVLWSFLFFGLRSPILGLFDIIILWILIILNAFKFSEIDKKAGLLFIPYLLWVSFAAYLNFLIVLLN